MIFRRHLAAVQQARRERNERLTARLRELGLSIRLEDAEALGRAQTGRPHFAQVLVNKGYVPNYREAFDRYLDESQPGYVERRDPSVENVLRWIREGRGHFLLGPPDAFHRAGRASPPKSFSRNYPRKVLDAAEAFHGDHTPEQRELLRRAAVTVGLKVTGGSDFHGGEKSKTPLGALNLPLSLLEDLRPAT